MLVICYGPDSYSRHQEIVSLRARLDTDGMLATNTTTLDARRATLTDLTMVCDAMPFLAERRLVHVYGLLARAESERPAGGRRGRGGRAATAPEEVTAGWLALAEYVDGMPPTTVLLLEDGDIRQGNPLLEALRAKATVQAFRRLSVRDIEGWIGERARRRGVLFESAALRLLAESVPTEAADDRQWHGLWGVAAEIEKLSLYAAGERITEQDVRRLTAAALESRAYLLADKVVERRAGEALAVLEELLAGGRPVAVLLSTIATRVRQLILLRYLSEQRVPRGEIQQRLAVRSDWQFDRLHEQAMRLPLPRLEAAHERLLDTDRAIKSGRMDETTAIEILVAELSS